MAGKKASGSRKNSNLPSEGGKSELVVIASSDTGLRAAPESVESATGVDTSSLSKLLSTEGISLSPMFGSSEEVIEMTAASVTAAYPEEPSLSQFYHVDTTEDRMEELVGKFLKNPLIEAAYIKPPAELAVIAEADREVKSTGKNAEESINEMQPELEGPPVTPNFIARQEYLNPAPVGVDARFAWRYRGGGGTNVRVIDLEWGWRFTHEDLLQNQGGVIAGDNSSSSNHGTAVIGEIGGDRTSFGVTGISPEAIVSSVSFTTIRTAAAIQLAANRLRPGDIMLLEIHRPGPRATGVGQQGFIAVEWWPDDFAAIRFATNRGIIVVEAAGNGAQNFDDSIYDTRPTGFPASWRNPFNPTNASSLAVVVGAGAPPPGTHGRNHGPDRSRLGFSNYGRRVDCQGWGREVTTTGYGDLQGGADPDHWYTDSFSGTSSASPIVVGSLACLQGILRARRQAVLTPIAAIRLLRTTGSPQADAPGRPRTQRIGNRPNLRQMIAKSVRVPVRTVPLFRYWNPSVGDHFFTTNWRELGRGRLGYRYEGIACFISPRRVAGTSPLYRYWNPVNTDHFYTTNWRELGRGRFGYRYEGIQGYVQSRRVTGSVPLYRYWNPANGDHFYTTNLRELGRGRFGYRYEGIQGFVYARATALSASAPETSNIDLPQSVEDEFDNMPADDENLLPPTTMEFNEESQSVLEKYGILGPNQVDEQFNTGISDINFPDEFEDQTETGDSFQMSGDTGSFGEDFETEDSLAMVGDDAQLNEDSFTMGETTSSDSFSPIEQEDSQGNIVINLNLGKK